MSFQVAKGVSVGSSKRRYEQGAEQETVIDRGSAVITDRRVVFRGDRRGDWDFGKLRNVKHRPGKLTMEVSNRKKASSLTYQKKMYEDVKFMLELARARFKGETQKIVEELTEKVQAIEARRPQPPDPDQVETRPSIG